MSPDLSAKAMKAWSQNLGQADVMTTFTSYGSVPTHRQGELIRAAGATRPAAIDPNAVILARALLAKVAFADKPIS